MSVRDRHKRERLARREAILAAAMSVFAAHGLDGATIEMIARKAEVAVGTIYLYFSSRDELFLTLMIERVGGLRDRYVEIRARRLGALEELRSMAGAYIEYLNRSRGLFVAQLSVSFSKLPTRLGRREELERFEEMRTLGRECFRLWADSVARVFDRSGDTRGAATTISTAMWATLNGAFLLSGDQEFFHDVTGLDATSLLTDVFDFQLAAAQSLIEAAPINGMLIAATGGDAHHGAVKESGKTAPSQRPQRRAARSRTHARYRETSNETPDQTEHSASAAGAGSAPRN